METIILTSSNLIIGKGSTKVAFDLNNGFIVLCPRVESNMKMIKELEIIQYIADLGLPVIENIKVVTISSRFGVHKGFLCRKIPSSLLYKPFGDPLVKLSERNLKVVQSIYNILTSQKILIVDLQLLYNNEELYIIDPSNIYNIETFFYLGYHRKRKHKDLYDNYLHQNRTLTQLINFNLSSSL